MRIDFHTHAFPDKIAAGAIESLKKTGGGLIPLYDGTIAGLLAHMDRSHTDISVVLSIATRPSHHASILRFSQSLQNDRLVPFASVHPHAPDAMEALEEIARIGIKGVKLHPQYQNFEVGDESLFPIYRKIGKLGLICVFHAGMDIGYPPPCMCTPESLARALPAFDGSPVVAAHFGGYMQWDRALDAYKGTGIYIDTSFSHSRVILPLAQQLIEMVGCDHVLFGSDSPWSDPALEVRLLDALTLSDAEKDAILCQNAARLLCLSHI